MTAVETLLQAVDSIYWMPDHFWIKDYKPGQHYEQLPEETKEKLRMLKSDDLRNVRMDLVKDVVGYCEYRGQWARDYRRRHAERT